MFRWAVAIWIAGLLTLVPYSAYYLFFYAQQQQYAILIVFILFWIFGYWGLAGPLLSALKVRAILKAIDQAREQGGLRELLKKPETRELAIDFIARDNRIPHFLAVKIYDTLEKRFSGMQKS